MQSGEPKAHLELNQARDLQDNKSFYKCMDKKKGRLGKKCRMGQGHLCHRAWKRQTSQMLSYLCLYTEQFLSGISGPETKTKDWNNEDVCSVAKD